MGDPGPWPIRAVWLLLPLLVGPAVSDLLDSRSRAVGWLASVLIFGGWGVGLVAVLVPHPLGLTTLRVLAPAVLATALAAIVAGEVSPGAAAAAVGGGVAALLVVAAPTTVDAMVDGTSYGSEQRLGLRTPLGIQLGPAPLARLAVVAGLATGPLLLACGQWLPGVLALVVGLPLAAFAARALHGLALRCLVLVPGGVVLADRMVLTDPVLLPRGSLAALGPAPADSDATDLTAGAAGLVVEVRLIEPVTISRRSGRHGANRLDLSALLIAPLRPGALLSAAAARRLPVGRVGPPTT